MPRYQRALKWSLAAVSAAAFVVGASAQQAARTVSQAVVSPDNPILGQDPQETPPAQDQTTGRGGRGAVPPPAPRPFAQVIPNDAKKDEGLLTAYRVGETLFFEVPRAELDKDMLWVTQIKRTSFGDGYGGQAVDNRVVRWQLLNNRVFLQLRNYSIVSSDQANPVAQAVADANDPTIVHAFNVAAFSPANNPVIDVTSMYLSDIPEFSARGAVGGRAMDAARSYIEKVKSFPLNVNVEITETFTVGPDTGAAAGGARGGAGGRGREPSATIALYHSMIKLPEAPMPPRLFDERVGYFTTSQYDYSRPEHKSVDRTFITRYRLEKKDPNAAVSDPVKPIVYYVDPATPKAWVPWIKKAVESWQPAFEQAGFSHAILAKDAPSKAEDPEWDAEDIRYSVIRYLPSTTENAVGPHISDPRSGEILNADIQYYHNVMNLATMWYFTQVGDLDPRAAKLPLPEDLMGRLVQYVVAHEIGHTIGFQHNMKSSSEYTIAQIRDKTFVHDMGHVATLMDYSRFNYVAQPEDGIPAEDLIPKIGPYDKWATHWGYAPIPNAKSPDDEKATLDSWAREQDSKPYLRFSTAGSAGSDPGDETEAVGDADATMATTLGMKNLKRVTGMVMTATAENGEPYDLLTEVYGRIWGQWTTEMDHVANVLGGYQSQQVHNGQPGGPGQNGRRFLVEPRAAQVGAVRFLLDNAFQTPTFMVNPDILRRIQPTGVVARVRTAQSTVMNALLQPARLDRLVEQNAVDTTTGYTPVQFLTDLRHGIWAELAVTPAKPIDVFRRNTQRVYLDAFDNRLNDNPATSDEIRALMKGELRALDAEIRTALPAFTDTPTRRHLEDARDQIAQILDPRAQRTPPAAAAAGAAGGRRGGGPGGLGAADNPSLMAIDSSQKYDWNHDPFLEPPTTCWPDRIIR
jgi:hypothetical protein